MLEKERTARVQQEIEQIEKLRKEEMQDKMRRRMEVALKRKAIGMLPRSC